MASPATPFQKAERQYEDTKRRGIYREVEAQDGRFAEDKFGRRIARSQLSLRGQQKGSSQAELGPQSTPLQLEGTHENCGIDLPAGKIMRKPLAAVEDHGSTPSLRSNPVKLSRRAAVKRNSTRDRKIKTARHDSTMQSSCISSTTSFNTQGIQPAAGKPSVTRRFSFDQTPNRISFSLAKLSNTLDFDDVPLSPAAGPDLEYIPSSVSEAHQQVRVSNDSSRPQLHDPVQRSHPATREGREQNMDTQEVDKEPRRVATTFDEILGERKIPTALM
jgi:hypothetical protein